MAKIFDFPRFTEPVVPKACCECTECGAEIYEGQDYVDYDSEPFCDLECVINYIDVCYKTAEFNDDRW